MLGDLVDLHHVLMADAGGGAGLAQRVPRAGDVAASCGAMTFKATTRWSISSKARKTMPNPPFPRTCNTS